MTWVWIILLACDLATGIWAIIDFDKGANFLAEAAGTSLTVLGIDQLLARSERKRLYPVRLMARRDLQAIARRCRSLITNVLNCVVRLEDLPLADFKNVRGSLLDRFDARAQTPVMYGEAGRPIWRPAWSEYLPQEIKKLEGEIDRFIERYTAFIDPRISQALQELQGSQILVQLRNIPTLLGMLQEGALPGALEDFAKRATLVAHSSAFLKADKGEANPIDLDQSIVEEVEAHVKQHPHAELHFEYRPRQ